MGKDAVIATFIRESQGADVAIIEGMMGLNDGLDPVSDSGSTAELALWLKAPVLLTVDASALARSINALALGFKSFNPGLNFAGMLCNLVGGKGHLNLLRRSKPVIPIAGGLPRCRGYEFTERHLGLVAAKKGTLSGDTLNFWAAQAEEYVDIPGLLEAAGRAPELNTPLQLNPKKSNRACRIAVARDDAFSFYYPDNLRRLEEQGADLAFFSPLKDKRLPEADGLILGGGYPELYAQELSANESMLKAVRAFSANGRPVYAECGGLLYLQKSLVTTAGDMFPMVGLFPGRAVMADRLQAIGYVEVITTRSTWLGEAGLRFRGHQFRYSSLVFQSGDEPDLAYGLHRRRDKNTTDEGYVSGQILASYVHSHWASNPNIPKEMVKRCSVRA